MPNLNFTSSEHLAIHVLGWLISQGSWLEIALYVCMAWKTRLKGCQDNDLEIHFQILMAIVFSLFQLRDLVRAVLC